MKRRQTSAFSLTIRSTIYSGLSRDGRKRERSMLLAISGCPPIEAHRFRQFNCRQVLAIEIEVWLIQVFDSGTEVRVGLKLSLAPGGCPIRRQRCGRPCWSAGAQVVQTWLP
jgi:hypothetical protein